MRVVQFPGCCTGKVVKDFGGTDIAEDNDEHYSIEDIKEELNRFIDRNRQMGNAFVCAVTNSEQEEANKALTEMGFSSSPGMTKLHHSETEVKLWWFPLHK